MTEWHYELAKAKSADIVLTRDTILDVSISFKLEVGEQALTGWCLDTPCWYDNGKYVFNHTDARKLGLSHDSFFRAGTAFGATVIRRIMEVFGVTSFKQIPGKYIYVLKDEPGFGGLIKGIEQLPVDGDRKLVIPELVEEFMDTVFDPRYAARLENGE